MNETLNATEDVAAPPPPAVPEPPPSVTTVSVVEALLLSTDEPLPAARIAQLLGIGDAGDVKRHVETLNERYAQCGASFRIEAIAKGFQLLTLSAYNHWISKLHKARADSRLSTAALETLAIVAYKQPVTRPEVEAIRGVNSDSAIETLTQYQLICEAGRKEAPGRPMLYQTTESFLGHFGLNSVDDLPRIDTIPADEAAVRAEVNASLGYPKATEQSEEEGTEREAPEADEQSPAIEGVAEETQEQ